jgi:thiamine biosynthesis lipoprotein ApbE
VAATAADAEVFAKAALVAGPETGPDLVTRHGLAAVVVADDDEVRATTGATDYGVGLTSGAGTRSS